MSVAVAPLRARRGRADARDRRGRIARLTTAGALAIAAAALIATEATTRAAEAILAREFIGLVAPGRAVAAGPIVWFGIGTPEVTGLVITTMCSTTVLAVPLLLLAVAITGITRAPTGRIGIGLLVGLGLAVFCNMVRFASAAWAYGAYGREGFDLVHRYVGSLFVIVGFVLAIVLLLRISLRESGQRGRVGRPAGPRTGGTLPAAVAAPGEIAAPGATEAAPAVTVASRGAASGADASRTSSRAAASRTEAPRTTASRTGSPTAASPTATSRTQAPRAASSRTGDSRPNEESSR